MFPNDPVDWHLTDVEFTWYYLMCKLRVVQISTQVSMQTKNHLGWLLKYDILPSFITVRMTGKWIGIIGGQDA